MSILIEFIKKSSVWIFLSVIFFQIGYNVFGVLANFWLSAWTDSNIDRTKNATINSNTGIIVYCALGFVQSIFNLKNESW